MEASNGFKERVRNVLIEQAQCYKNFFVEYEYLVCSDAFKNKNYYIIDAHEDNYMHLSGISSDLKADVFYDRCIRGTLSVDDFGFTKKGQTEKAVKGSVRRKIKAMPNLTNLFSVSTKVEEDFVKNTIKCSFAIGNEFCTLGFTETVKVKPKTLLKGDEVNDEKSKPFKVVLRKRKGTKRYNEIVVGNTESIKAVYPEIQDLIDESLIG